MVSLKKMRHAVKLLLTEYAKIQTYDREVEDKTIFYVIKTYQMNTRTTS